jgi:hypothetical protein
VGVPTDVREYRFLANAYLKAHAYQQAVEIVEAGLELGPDHAAPKGGASAPPPFRRRPRPVADVDRRARRAEDADAGRLVFVGVVVTDRPRG